MDPIEQRIRESYARVSREGANVSLDYNLLTVEETRFLLEQLDEARGKSGPTINERFEQSDDEHSFLALARWVDSELARCEASGSIFDTGFRCVSEGGEVFEFDPEVVVKVFVEQEEMIDALGQICCGVAFTNGQYEEHNEHARTHSVCAFCGAEDERTPEAMLAHMKKCEKHPFGAVAAGLDKVAEVAARTGDDLCWRYTEEILEAFGYGKREVRALPYEQFIYNCGRFHRALETGEKYETAEERDKRIGEAAVAKYIADVAARRAR